MERQADTNIKKQRQDISALSAETILKYFFQTSIDMLCVANMDGYFLMINPAFSKTLGYSSDELLSQPFLHFVHPHDHDETILEMNKLKHGARTLNFENRYRC